MPEVFEVSVVTKTVVLQDLVALRRTSPNLSVRPGLRERRDIDHTARP